MKNPSKPMFCMIMVFGSLMAMSANSWMSAWMGLEINLLAFIPLMNDINNLKSSEASLKYFLAQALASSILLFAVILFMMKFNIMFHMEMKNNFSKMIIASSLLLKSGTAPFHFWFPEVMEGLSWSNSFILMTWQKLAPLMMISYMSFNNSMYIAIIISAMVGSLGGLNQTSLRKIMAFSSINHLAWMLSAMSINKIIWISYFIAYSMLSASIIWMFSMFNMFHFNQMFSLSPQTKYLKLIMMINLLSLGGLPPFTGFIPKWMVIQYLTSNGQTLLVTILIFMTMITLFFYLRMSFSAMMINNHENSWLLNVNLSSHKMVMFIFPAFSSTFGLPIISMIYTML